MSDVYQSLAHSKWDCNYHVVFAPKRRRKVIFGNIRRQLGPVFHALAKQKECQIVEGHWMPDQVHLCIAIPPKHPVASVIGFLKGKSADCHRAAFWKGEELLWRTFLGSRLRGVHGRVRTGAGAPIHPRAGGRGCQQRELLN